MKTNPNPIALNHKRPRNCEGFYDAEGKELHIGDEIIVHQYRRVYHAVIVRFTPRRIYWTVLRAGDHVSDYVFNWTNFSQLHYYYGTGRAHGNCAPENPRSLRCVMKVEEVS